MLLLLQAIHRAQTMQTTRRSQDAPTERQQELDDEGKQEGTPTLATTKLELTVTTGGTISSVSVAGTTRPWRISRTEMLLGDGQGRGISSTRRISQGSATRLERPSGRVSSSSYKSEHSYTLASLMSARASND